MDSPLSDTVQLALPDISPPNETKPKTVKMRLKILCRPVTDTRMLTNFVVINPSLFGGLLVHPKKFSDADELIVEPTLITPPARRTSWQEGA
jgi:hypothetical protein